VLDGLEGHERVVTRGAFAIDSQAQIAGLPSLFAAPPSPAEPAAEPRDLPAPAAAEPAQAARSERLRLPPRQEPASPEQELCPVLGHPVDRTAYVDYRGVRIYFCCHLCTPKFLADPERYLPNLPQSMQERIAAFGSGGEAGGDG
jgi:YHS domain-containing protein